MAVRRRYIERAELSRVEIIAAIINNITLSYPVWFIVKNRLRLNATTAVVVGLRSWNT